MRVISVYILVVASGVVLAEGPRYDEQKSYELKYRCWVPVKPDMNTFRLYHLEDATSDAEIDLSAESLEAEEEEPATSLGGQSASVRTLKDSSLLANASLTTPATFEGECSYVADGRFGGGLRLHGGISVAISPLSLSRHSIDISGWFKPKRLAGTLFCVPSRNRDVPALELLLNNDGTVSLKALGKELERSSEQMVKGEWCHLAVGFPYGIVIPHGSTTWRSEVVGIQAFINGKSFFWKEDGSLLRELSATVLIGNDTKRSSAFTGVIDEIHIAREHRGYYIWDRSLMDPDSSRGLPAGPPWFRSKDDLVAHFPLDESLESATGEKVRIDHFRKPDKTGPALFGEGIRSKGVLAGRNVGSPAWTFSGEQNASEGSIEFWFSPHDWDNRRKYEVLKPRLTMGLLRVEAYSKELQKTVSVLDIDVPLLTEVKKLKAESYYPLLPGTWYHAIVVWRGHSAAFYVDGEPAEQEFLQLDFRRFAHQLPKDATLHTVRLGDASTVKMHGNGRLPLVAGATVFDELRVYSRRLSESEVKNAYGRYLPETPVKPLPFAEIALTMNYPRRQISTSLLMLSNVRDKVASVRVKITNAQGQVVSNELLPPPSDATIVATLTDKDVGYGKFTGEYTFLDRDEKVIHTQTKSIERIRPAWLGSTLGIHEGEVLPGWTPMKYADGTISCWGRTIQLDGRGWPASIVSQGHSMLASPVQISLKVDGQTIDLKPSSDLPSVKKQQDDLVITSGLARGKGWEMRTNITTEFDGLMKVATSFTGPKGSSIEELRMDIPLHFEPEQLYGFWAGGRNFRGACDYRKLPSNEGVIFSSNKTGRGHGDWHGKVSFVPYISICDDWRGFVWLAENDRNWNQSWTVPAQEIVRRGKLTTLRLNLIHSQTEYSEPLEYVFGIQPTPIRPLRKDWRTFSGDLSFSTVDGFNGCWLRSDDGGHTEFTLAPKGLDWNAVPRRNRRNIKHLLYLDRAWQRAPEDAAEWNYQWRGWGDATRYTPDVRDCYIYYMNEWIRRGFIRGVYIDDVWIKPTLSSLGNGPAYRRDGKMSWGVEFFAFRETLKRLRWLFHDNGMKPQIWVHATQTPYVPMLAFVDVILEGEDRFLPPNHKSNFILSWGLDRIRYSNGTKWGVPSNWMNKIGAEVKKGGTPFWFFRQHRAYQAALALCDIRDAEGSGGRTKLMATAGMYDDDAEFFGYWHPNNPVKTETENHFASVYFTEGRMALLLVNGSKASVNSTFTVDVDAIQKHLKSDNLVLTDWDTTRPPEDIAASAIAIGNDAARQIGNVAEGKNEIENEEADPFEESLAQEKKDSFAATPEGRFEEGRYEFTNNRIQLKVRPFDYRLFVFRSAEDSAAE